MSSADNLQDVLLQAMEIIATSAVKESGENYDKTLWNCKIIEDTNKKNGLYRVTSDGVNFDAYSSITTYNKDDHVAVVVPNGDFNNIKYIQQKIAADGTKLPYASPLDNYIQITNNLVENIFTETALYQSDGDRKNVGKISLDGEYTAKNPSNKIIYNNLGLECEFQVNLQNELIKKKGTYGVEIDLTYYNEANIEQTEKLEFNSSEFYGDPYSFIIPSKQQKAFALVNKERLKKIQIFLVKDFEVNDNINAEIPLIKLTNLKIGFGSDIAKIPDDTLEIYTLDNFEYLDGEEGQTKNIGIVWFNKDEDNNYLGFSDGIYDADYDEEEYLQEKAETKALDDEFNKVGAPTTVKGIELAADITVVENSVASILSQVDKIMSAAAGMRDSIRGAISEIIFEENGQTITALNFLQRICDKSSSKEETEGYLIKYHKDVEEQYQQFIKYYRKGLGFPIEEEVSRITSSALLETTNTLDDYLTIDDDIDSAGFYTIGEDVANTISSDYGGYASLYTSYNEKIKGYRNTILAEIDKIQEIFEKENGFDNRFNLIGGDSDEEYESSFEEDDYAHRYCIYWYKYSRGQEDAIAGKDWERLDQNNFGIPETSISKNEIYYNAALAENSTFEYQIDASAAEEKVMAILFYNHNQYKSEPLVFKRVTSDGTLADDNGALKIEHGNKSQSNYQNYGEDNYLISASDSRHERTLSLSFSSSIGQTFDDLVGGQIYWYLPKNNTMLAFGTNEDYAMGIDSTSIPAQHYKAGYFCFNKTITADSITGNVDTKTLQFKYKIKDYYSNSFSNNTIYCKIVKGSWNDEAEINFNFSSYGTNGTEYTLMISPALGSGAAVTADKPMELSVKLLNYKNEEIPLYQTTSNTAIGLYGANVQVSWVESKNSIKHPISQAITDNLGQITGYTLTADGDISCGIMRIQTTVKFKQNGTSNDVIKIASYYCVPYNIPLDGDNVDFVEGATKITYSTSGNNPKFYKDPYKLFSGRTGEEIESKWSIYDAAGNQNNYPTFNESNQLTPKNSYIPTEGFLLVCAKVNDINRWYQPIYIEQDKYEFNLLNKWDGKLQINEDGGYILSNMLVAGTKNSQNQFTGVMLGDMKIAEGSIVESGLFGFHEGAASFGFKTDGTAFIGKAGSGRIEFDGNHGVIRMGQIIIDSSPEDENPYFSIGENGEILKVDKNTSIFNGTWILSKGKMIGQDQQTIKTILASPGNSDLQADALDDSYILLSGGTEENEFYEYPLRLTALGGLYATKGKIGNDNAHLAISGISHIASSGAPTPINIQDMYLTYDYGGELKQQTVFAGTAGNSQVFYIGKGGIIYNTVAKNPSGTDTNLQLSITKIGSHGLMLFGGTQALWVGTDGLRFYPGDPSYQEQGETRYKLNKKNFSFQITSLLSLDETKATLSLFGDRIGDSSITLGEFVTYIPVRLSQQSDLIIETESGGKSLRTILEEYL